MWMLINKFLHYQVPGTSGQVNYSPRHAQDRGFSVYFQSVFRFLQNLLKGTKLKKNRKKKGKQRWGQTPTPKLTFKKINNKIL